MALLSSCVTEDQPDNEGVEIGDPLPSFSLTLNDGRRVSTKSLRGKKVLIELFNTSCPDCQESLPTINTLYNSMKDREDIEIFAIARDEVAAAIALYWEDNNFTLPYSPQPDRKVYELFASVGIPRIFIANPDGIITATFGPEDNPTLSQLTTLLKEYLTESCHE
ncbi:MAG: TlpA family protein disulfide reductase, partial [Muribaculaceae bacterium]|nr:TlpA family protein disulfide reductase [Muribaculaceae bacterium]